jgi:SAM-dependent methyltransferase
MDLKESQILGERAGEHWYYSAKAAALKQVLHGHTIGRVLDVGAGSGFFARCLLTEPTTTEATCVDIGYTGERDETHAGKPISFRLSADAVKADTVLLMDVLEHVEDEGALLKPFVDQARPGTLFVVTVPAFAFMWSGHDVFLGHWRRYTRSSLLAAVTKCGLKPLRSHYYYALVFPLAFITRFAGRLFGNDRKAPKSQLSQHSPLANAVLRTLCAIERPVMRLNSLFGLTVFAVFRKP